MRAFLLLAALTMAVLLGGCTEEPEAQPPRQPEDYAVASTPSKAKAYQHLAVRVYAEGDLTATQTFFENGQQTKTSEWSTRWGKDTEVEVLDSKGAVRAVVEQLSDRKWNARSPDGRLLYHVTRDYLDGFHVETSGGEEVIVLEPIVDGYKLTGEAFEGVRTELTIENGKVKLKRFDLDKADHGTLSGGGMQTNNIFSNLWSHCYPLPVEVKLGMISATYHLKDLQL